MKDIRTAIEKEEEYLRRKVGRGDNTANIYDYIIFGGYDNLIEFYSDRAEYLLRDLYYQVVEEPYIGDEIPTPFISTHTPAFLYTINCPVKYAFVPDSFGDTSAIEALGYTVLNLSFGTEHEIALSTDGDLRVYIIIPDEIPIYPEYFVSKLASYLSGYMEGITHDSNDIYADGRKICGSVVASSNGMRAVMFQINYNDHNEDVSILMGDDGDTFGVIDSSVLSPEQVKGEMLGWLIGQ